jgi:thymidylate synthase
MVATEKKLQFNYTPRYQPNQLICGNGQTAVVTGWTVKQTLAKHLQPDEFAVIGQLYSPTRGISFLVRNLLANPHVRFLVILNATKEDRNAGACECLLDFFRNGFFEGFSDNGRKCWVICSAVPGYIDIQIEASALEQLRQSVEWQEAKSITEAVSQVKSYAQLDVVESWSSPLEFPLSEVVPTVLPGPRYGHRIEGKTIAETWVKIIHRIKTTGTIRPSRYDSLWQELIDLTAIVTEEPHDFYFPEPNYLPCDRSFIDQYVLQILGSSSSTVTSSEERIEYTYGERLRSWFDGHDQIEQVIQKLSKQIDSASAVMSLWDVRDHEADKSPPCLNHIWVRVVDNELSLTATFRSNDMFSAWPANAIGLRALQQHIRDEIASRSQYNLCMGPLITVSQSAHIYEDCWENADRLIQSQYVKTCQQRNYDDSSGNFAISVQDGKILVERTTAGFVERTTADTGEVVKHHLGEVVKCYSAKSAIQLYQQIAADCPSLQVEHAMYLGTELQKAELAVSTKHGFVYEQDKPLRSSN